ncbi:Hsp20/alpha crystallin family protein [Anaeromyxobacter sp. Fw109-5]|uniref:Hsp20/alpha crystallin family protein n=1 Tax=Anaeromyxobacter sp. (strain Fw109-5) TaxID=404589 RepID=UPI00059DEA2A|nr:Hsp20/alpha crystallin family protein [Anaeromyxobacter sp. Fw109-5]
MRRLLDDMQRVGEEYDPLRFAPPTERDVEPSRPTWAPKVDVFERDGVLVLRADLPGVRKEDIRVDVTGEAVTLQGERRRERDVEGAGVHCAERTCGSFYRSIPLPEGVKVERAEARVDNGVLEVTIPLDERRMPSRRVEVQGAGPQSNVQ